jgi:hypothetical protein
MFVGFQRLLGLLLHERYLFQKKASPSVTLYHQKRDSKFYHECCMYSAAVESFLNPTIILASASACMIFQMVFFVMHRLDGPE